MMFAAAALAVCTGTAYGQVLDVAPVGDAVMPDGRRVYAMPQTTVVVDITVARESVVTGRTPFRPEVFRGDSAARR